MAMLLGIMTEPSTKMRALICISRNKVTTVVYFCNYGLLSYSLFA
jgi:hypothetical protein